MTHSDRRLHIGALTLIFVVALLVNGLPYVFAGLSPAYNQSSDATVHVTDWQEFSPTYPGTFAHDVMFTNFSGVSSGVLGADKALVRVSEWLRVPLLDWSILISTLSLIAFLSGVYFLVLYSTKNTLLALLIGLVSVIPVISLGLSSWGFTVTGFVPKETSLAIAVWLLILYLRAIATESRKRMVFFFVLLGICANWYPPFFIHLAIVLLTVEVLRARAITKDQFLYGILFLVAAPLALYDIFVIGGHFTKPDLSIIYDHYGAPLHSLSYLLLHYLRKQIIYAVVVGLLWYLHRRLVREDLTPLMRTWYFIWWSTLFWSLIGVGIEVFFPLYMKYLISRISVWFYLASMIVIASTGYAVWRATIKRSALSCLLFSAVVLLVLVSQTSLPSVYAGALSLVHDAPTYKQYLAVVTQASHYVPSGTLVLANPDGEANTVRAYGSTATYVAAKDGNVVLYDGRAAEAWFTRYKELQQIFAKKDFAAVQSFAQVHGLHYFLFDAKDFTQGLALLKRETELQDGTFGIAYIP
jgi:hypothetical protein